jgi:squalene-associated FAD-dependent desaturase
MNSQSHRVHIIGAGIAGLVAALRLTQQGREVVLYEAAPHAGGRCRSYDDNRLRRELDNGNHLIVQANHTACGLLKELGTLDQFYPLQHAYPMADIASGERWQVRPMRLPHGFQWVDMRRMLQLLRAKPTQTVAEIFPPATPLFRKFIEPVCTATLNTRPELASATMFRHVLCRMLLPGAASFYQVKTGWGGALIAPMLQRIRQAGGAIHYQKRLQRMELEGDAITALQFGDGVVPVEAGEKVILATPPDIAATLLGEASALHYHKIINGHFLWEGAGLNPPILGVVGSPLQWVMAKEGLLSTTTSDADHSALHGLNQTEVAQLLWRDICRAMGWQETPLPAHRIVTEKRATFAATPENLPRRPSARTAFRNLILAGDAVTSPLPATIEAAIKSGQQATQLI